jgi:acyl-CoA dehydrogenase
MPSDRGISPGPLHGKTAMAKLAASEAAGRIVDRAVQIFGAVAASVLYREIRRERILNGTSEIQRLIVGRTIRERGLDALLRPPGPAG